MTATMSVVVPALNESEHIGRCLRSIFAQEPAPLEVIVVDGGSTDDTARIARRQGARVLRNPKRIIPAAMNIALREAHGELIVRLDAHSEMRRGYLAACLRALRAEPHAANVGGWCEVHPSGRWGAALAAALASPVGVGNARLWRRPAGDARRMSVDSVPFGCYRADRVHEVGGWDERLGCNEDYELNARLRASGSLVVFDPAIGVVYRPRETLEAIARQYFRYGRWKATMLRRSPRTLRPRQFAPPALLTVAALAVLPGPLARPARAVLLGYLATLSFAARRSGSWRTAIVLAAMHTSWAAGLCVGIGSGRSANPA